MKKAKLAKLKLPDGPGIYQFKDDSGEILYIGKATSLRDRVRSYFGDDLVAQRGQRLVDMVAKADTVDHIPTDSVLEALVLEANLITKHQPKYNAIGKDDKSFHYVVITKEEFPRVLIMRGHDLDRRNNLKLRAKFGPFPYGTQLREALRIIRKIFPFNDKDSIKKEQAEFYRQIKLAPDLGNSEIQKRYSQTIDHIILFFKGEKKKLIKELHKKMMDFAGLMKFEDASDVKRQIFSLEHIRDVSLIKKENIDKRLTGFRIEAYDVAHISGTSMVGVMTVIEQGEPEKSEYRKFKVRGFDKSNDVGALEEIFRRRMGHAEWTFPDMIVVDGAMPQKSRVEKVLRELGVRIPVVALVKDEKHKPKGLLGQKELLKKYKDEIILVNAESHRFAIKYHRELRGRDFKKKK